MQILVLGGGNSPEREVSLRSAAAVNKALEEAGFSTKQADLKDGFSCLDDLATGTIVFPILHGAEGEDGIVQAEMEKRGLPFLGSGSKVSVVCFDKNVSRERLHQAGIPIPNGAKVTAGSYKNNPLAAKPHALKVARGGSSIGTYLVRDPSSIDQQKVAEVFELDTQAVIEELIIGTEITVPILDGKALPVIEIRPPVDGEFDYENKYNGKTAEICPAESIDESAQKAAQELSEKVNTLFGCRHLSRVDIMVRQDGTMAVLEDNTMPGLTDQSLYPKSAKVAGLPMPELVTKFVELVKRDYKL
jgi:D-alanine-D-alanine ligase